jgi:hypothetical protein
LKSYSFSPWEKEQRNRTQTKGIGTRHSSKRERERERERDPLSMGMWAQVNREITKMRRQGYRYEILYM